MPEQPTTHPLADLMDDLDRHGVTHRQHTDGNETFEVIPHHDSSTASPSVNLQQGLNAKLNWLRAGVLGANDGIVSGAGIVIGVAAVNSANSAGILTAGVAGLLAGASSMALGEYVSVSSQRDTEHAIIAQERHDLEHTPEAEFHELVQVFMARGLSEPTAQQVVHELTEHDALTAHLHVEYGVDQEDLTNPWHAAFASAAAFTVGTVIPLISIMLAPQDIRIIVTVAVALLALLTTGWISAKVSGGSTRVPMLRNLIGGSIALFASWGIAHLFGAAMIH